MVPPVWSILVHFSGKLGFCALNVKKNLDPWPDLRHWPLPPPGPRPGEPFQPREGHLQHVLADGEQPDVSPAGKLKGLQVVLGAQRPRLKGFAGLPPLPLRFLAGFHNWQTDTMVVHHLLVFKGSATRKPHEANGEAPNKL